MIKSPNADGHGSPSLARTRSISVSVLRRVGDILRRNYVVYRTYRTIRAYFSSRGFGRNPILLLQMGKVGSTSAGAALRLAISNRQVVHVHGITRWSLSEADAYYRERFERDRSIDAVFIRSRIIARKLPRMRRKSGLDIVTVVRDPGARQLSAFFQTLRTVDPDLACEIVCGRMSDEMLERIRERFRSDAWLEDPFVWFSRELLPISGVDVFDYPFDPAKGYEVYESDSARVLLLRFEDMNFRFARAVEQFLGVKDVRLPHKNVGSEKYYADVLAEFKRDPPFTEAELDRLYDSPRARHFYTAEELERLRNHWHPRAVDS